MEFWTLLVKAILLIYVVLAMFTDITATPWYVLSFLVYLCLNLLIAIFKNDQVKQIFMGLSILFIIVFSYVMSSWFILLLSLNLYEMAAIHFRKDRTILAIMFLPLFFIDHNRLALYGLMAVLNFAAQTRFKLFADRTANYEMQIEKLRADLYKLSKNLNENNEYLRQSEYTFKLEERNRLSQEIHDKIGHSMTSALIQMEAVKRLLVTDPDKAAQLLQNAIHISQEGIESIRLTLKNISPPTELLGINRLKLFIDEFSAKNNHKTSFIYGGDMNVITPIQWKVIQENIKEAFTNSLKYGEAAAIFVELRVLGTYIKVDVSDNGKGARKVVKGLGILGMEERTASVNGTVIVDGSRGFSVTTLIPYAKQG